MAAQDTSDVVADKHLGQVGACKACSQEERVNLRIVLQEADASGVCWSAYDPDPLPVEKGQIFKVIDEKMHGYAGQDYCAVPTLKTNEESRISATCDICGVPACNSPNINCRISWGRRIEGGHGICGTVLVGPFWFSNHCNLSPIV